VSNFSTGEMGVPSNLVLASWTDRFLAWLIDFIIVSIGLGILFAALSLPFWFDNNMVRAYKSIEPLHYIISSVVFLAYWTCFEFKTGQSIGKRLLHLKTTDLSGKLIDPKIAAIESFGKSFLLPFDVVLGWIFTNKRRQRIFSKISNTVVIKLKEEDDYGAFNNVKYLKD
jgi:uncharacterized RDD family membrane protein YckC